MSVYNSQVGSFHDDSDITIINPSIIQENNDEDAENTQITHSQTVNRDTRSDVSGRHDYVFVEGPDPSEAAKQLEQVLTSYIRDLKQESNTQLDCDKQLVTRLMDLIRPAYINDQQKMIQLDKVIGEIGVLHDKRHIEQKEKIELLRTEVNRLNRMLFTASNDQSIYNDTTRNYSMATTINRGYTSTDFDQWTEIEDDAKKLHQIVQSQRNQINEIISLISQTAPVSPVIQQVDVPEDDSADDIIKKLPIPTPPTPNPLTTNPGENAIESILEKIRHIVGGSTKPAEVPTTPVPATTTTLMNHSPGSSPTQSLNTLTSLITTTTVVEPKKEPEPEPEPEPERPHPPIDIPVPPPAPSPAEAKKCPVCNFVFPATCDDVEMYDHIEKCLFPTETNVEVKDYECPNCNGKFPGHNDAAYLQHLTECYNQGF